VMAAVSMTGASPERLALGRTTVVQLAAAFANRIAPAGLGAMATNARYLERSGVRRARAVTAVGVNQAAGGLVHVAALLVVLPLAGYLIAIAWALLDTKKNVAAIADGLEAVRNHTAPLPEKLTTINGALGALLGGLEAADRHVGRAARVFRLS